MTSEQLLNILEDYRKKIDLVDDEIKKYLELRFDYVKEIAVIKKSLNISSVDTRREQEILNRITKGLDSIKLQYIQNIFERIIDESRAVQRKITGKNPD